MTSAKKMIGIKQVMQAVVDRLPSPLASLDEQCTGIQLGKKTNFLGRIVDSWFDSHRGVVCLIQIVAGILREGERITTFASVGEAKDIDNRTDFSVQEVK